MIKLDEIEDLELPQIKKFYSDHVSIGIPKILGTVRINPNLIPEAVKMLLFGPGVANITK